jgi:chromosome segregation ATPase
LDNNSRLSARIKELEGLLAKATADAAKFEGWWREEKESSRNLASSVNTLTSTNKTLESRLHTANSMVEEVTLRLNRALGWIAHAEGKGYMHVNSGEPDSPDGYRPPNFWRTT